MVANFPWIDVSFVKYNAGKSSYCVNVHSLSGETA